MFMLAGRDDDRLKAFLKQFVDHGRKFDRLGPRPKQDKNLHPPINGAAQNFTRAGCHVVEHTLFRSKDDGNSLADIHLNTPWFLFAMFFMKPFSNS